MRAPTQLPPYPGTGRTSPSKVETTKRHDMTFRHTNITSLVQLVTYEVWKNRLGGRSSSPEKGPVETQVTLEMLPILGFFKPYCFSFAKLFFETRMTFCCGDRCPMRWQGMETMEGREQ